MSAMDTLSSQFMLRRQQQLEDECTDDDQKQSCKDRHPAGKHLHGHSGGGEEDAS